MLSFASQFVWFAAWQNFSGSDTILTVLIVILLVLFGFIAWTLHRMVEAQSLGVNKLKQKLRDFGDQTAKLVDEVSELRAQSSDNAGLIVDAIGKITIATSQPATPGAPAPSSVEIEQPKSSNPSMGQETNQKEDSEALLAKAQALLAKPDVNYPENLLQARDLLRSIADGPLQSQASVALSETLFWLGDMSKDKSEQEKFHGEGVAHGKTSVSSNPDSVAANLWYAANMGSHGVARGIMSSLFYLGDIEKYGKKAMELDKTYFHAAPLRLMGRFYHQCPGWPIGSGDKNKAIKILQEAFDSSPEFLLNGLYLAEVLIDKRKKKEARKVLEDMLSISEPEIMPVYQKTVQNSARALLAKI